VGVERPELGRGEELGMSSDGIKRWRLGTCDLTFLSVLSGKKGKVLF
jgi:hypothetical protein